MTALDKLKKQIEVATKALEDIAKYSAYDLTGDRDVYSYKEAFEGVRSDASDALAEMRKYDLKRRVL